MVRFKRASAAVLVALACASAGRAAPGLVIGVDDDTVKWSANPWRLVGIQRSLGARALRVTLSWSPGESSVADSTSRLYLQRIDQAERLGDRVVLSVFGSSDSPPSTGLARVQYCEFVLDALQRAPGVNDVVIWNEANSPKFWRPQAGAAADYEALLAQCYDTLHSRRPWVNVISSTAPHHNPGAFIAALGDAYRASGRTLPIFDTFGHNVYPNTDREEPFAQHRASSPSIDEGDYGRLLAALTSAFGGTAQPVPGEGSVRIWYLEDGFQTVVPAAESALYTGRELDRFTIPAVAPSGQEESTSVDQATQLATALELAYCQPAVGAFFNFQLADDHDLGGWQSGLLWADWTPKPSAAALQAAVAAVAAGQVDCSRFPAAAVGRAGD